MTDDKLRELVALNIMGWEIRKRGRRVYNPAMGCEIGGFRNTAGCQRYIQQEAPNCLTWAGIGLVVKEMLRKGWSNKITQYDHESIDNATDKTRLMAEVQFWNGPVIQVRHPSVSRAVSLAALKAVGVEVEEA